MKSAGLIIGGILFILSSIFRHLGINAGASFFVVVAVSIFSITSLNHFIWIAFLGAALAAFIVFILARKLNVQELGDELATGLGSQVQKQRLKLAADQYSINRWCSRFCWGIGFVGLMAPHIARRLVGSAFGALLPVSALIGALLVLVADLIGRTAFSPHEVPAGVFTAAIGAPYFIYLLFKNRHL